MSEGYADLLGDTDFKNYVYKQIEKQFDGDYNVLLNKVENEYGNKLKSAKINNTISFFDSINKYPQIFIPFYENLKNSNKIGANNPILVIYTDENENGEYVGYQLNGSGNLQKLDFLIDEDFARNNEVWVFSINERVDENGEVVFNVEDLSTISLYMDSKSEIITPETGYLKSAMACTPPSTPQNLQVFPFLPYKLNLQWQDIQGVAYYKVYREVNYSGNYTEIATVYDPNSSYSDNNLSVGIHYDYKIRAFNASDCYSALSYGAGGWASWRTDNYNDILNQIYISDGCWNWCCSWPEGKIELMYRIVKYNKADQQVEYPKNSLPQKSKDSQKGKWCTYGKKLFRWDVKKYAYNYLLFFYEDDGGDDKGTTIKLSASFKPTDKINVGAEISFTIDDRDEELGWVGIYHFDPIGKEYSLAPRKGSAKIKVRQ